jgi:DNA polymerase-1
MPSLIADKILPEDMALELLKQCLETGGPRIAIDTETNGKDCRDGRGYAYGVSVAYRSGDGVVSFYMPFRHKNPGICGNYDKERFLHILQKILEHRTGIYHNAQFDLVSLSTLGLNPDGHKFLCTMMQSRMVADDDFLLAAKGYSLDACSQHFLNRPGKKKSDLFNKLFKQFGWEDMPPEGHGEYAAYDTYSTYELYETLRPMLINENQGEVWNHKQKFVRLMIDIEKNGIRVDTDFCDAMAEEGEIRQYEIKELWKNRYGRPLNPGSPKDLKFLLRDTLKLPVVYHHKTGQPTFDKSAMEQYEQILELLNNPLADEILEYRGWNKSVSSNYQAYINHLSPDGRLRTNYNLLGTKTGRLSSYEPNLQQIPKSGNKPWNGRMKQCFIPEDGYELIECDYSQLEFRLQAAVAREQVLLDIFADPSRDVFDELSETLGWPRQLTKTFVYSIAYGAGTKRIAFVFRVSLERAREYINFFYAKYPALRAANNRAAYEVERNGKIQLWSGRYRHFRYPDRDSYMALNSYIQGGAADIVERTMLRCAEAGLNDGTRSRMLLQVHDSIVFEVRKEDKVDASAAIQSIMSNVQPDFGVVFKADPKVWGS